MRFKGKVVVVTGGGKNIGAGIASAFGAEGAEVAVDDIDLAAAEEIAHKINASGGKAWAWGADVSDAAAVSRMVAEVRNQMGPIHILINNAALVTRTAGTTSLVVDMPDEEWDRFFRINVKGPFLMSREVARAMIKDCIKGRIINITSGAAESARIGASHYCSSKAALSMFTRVLAMELAPHGITANAVSPGLFPPPQKEPLTEGRKLYLEATLSGIPVGRFGRPEEIARTVLFLAEDGSDYISGATVRVDGGSMAGRTHLPRSY
jgi:NAD(P)-dependent dehydrogenase (short-subunit alcohol dehydrogenase family)